MIAHVGGVPVEELLPLAVASGGGAVAFGRAWVRARWSRRRDAAH